ncbi:unnamed protein product [Allacma fusca]|uniref:SAC domain-containing protein n=1 Tax=Allacma fusca TaxID=39272 RepID=A0A8J2LNZ2_9HEXA|nr:unnamed protein product [Allacma fusca]
MGSSEKVDQNEKLRPFFISIQKMVLYETKTHFYLVGSNLTETRFRILKMDRTENRELTLVEDQASYNAKEIKDLLSTIAVINRPKNPIKLVPAVSAFGILGFIRFLEGYYIVLITKRRVVATIGHHSVYKIEDTACIYLPNEGATKNPDEIRYLKLFQSIDLSSNFYFTYSYDLTNTLQYNMTPPKNLVPASKMHSFVLNSGYGIRGQMNTKFVWNNYLLRPLLENDLRPDWILPVTHGFVGQSNLCIYGKPIYLTLIARRSARYAGTRFLKRGSNFQGEVANEVHTEQIVFDSSVSSFNRGNFTSFVQMRGSIPAHWSQDISKMVPKPPIGLDLADPYAETAGKHFGELLERYGSPIVVLNLVKKREPPKQRIHYVGFDMARTNKMKEENVMSKLAGISEEIIAKTGFFHGQRPVHTLGEAKLFSRKQTGLARVNCVDCLDRTNTAQFALGKCALAHQLRTLNVLNEDMELEFDTDTIRMLEVLFEDHGDTLALQYGGSQLVHRINTYRKTAPWTSEGNDIMQTLSRYYSNTFSDADKQNAINLFLGVYQPAVDPWPLWTLESDYFYHLVPIYRFTNTQPEEWKPLTEWYSDAVLKSLPFAAKEMEKTCTCIPFEVADDVDCYSDFYRPRLFVPLQDTFAFKISHSVRDFMPHFTTDYSPFAIRIRPGKRQEEINSKKAAHKIISLKNPSIVGVSSASSQTSTSSDTDYSSSEEMSSSMTSANYASQNTSGRTQTGDLVFSKFFPTMKESYGVEIKSPRKSDVLLYKRYVNFQQLPGGSPTKNSVQIIPLSGFSKDDSFEVTPPTVSRFSRDVYRNYVARGEKGAAGLTQRDHHIYNRYVAKSGDPLQIARERLKQMKKNQLYEKILQKTGNLIISFNVKYSIPVFQVHMLETKI